MVATTFSLSASTRSAGKLVGRGPRVAGLALPETATNRRLAAADLVIALCLGHGAPVIFSTPRGADDTAAGLPKRGSAPYTAAMLKY